MTEQSDSHVAMRRLLDLRDGHLSDARAGDVRTHLATGCAKCAADAAWIERTVLAISEGPPDAPPAAEEVRAIRLYAETWCRIDDDFVRGVLLLDQPSEYAEAVRCSSGETRRLLWRVGDYEVDASLVARAGGTDVLAQIVPGGDDPDATVEGTVTARTATRVRASAAIEPDGRFTFRALSAGVYTLEGRVDALRFVLPPLHIE